MGRRKKRSIGGINVIWIDYFVDINNGTQNCGYAKKGEEKQEVAQDCLTNCGYDGKV